MTDLEMPVVVRLDGRELYRIVTKYALLESRKGFDVPSPDILQRDPEPFRFSSQELISYTEEAMIAAFQWLDVDLSLDEEDELSAAAASFVGRRSP